MSKTTESFEIPDDVIDLGADGYATNKSTRPRIETMKSGDSAVVYFVTDPWESNEAGDWINYREVAAFQGFKGGMQLPMGYKEFPVFDQEVLQTANEVKRTWRRNADGSPADWLLEQVAPPTRFKTKSGRAEGRDRLIFNVVDHEGVHKLVKVSGTIGRQLRKQAKSYRKLNKDFTLLKNPWKLIITGSGLQQEVVLEPLDEAYPDSMRPDEPINAREVLRETRAYVENFYKDALERHTETFDEEPGEESEDFTTVEPDADAEPEQDDPRTVFNDMTANDLRDLLAANDVNVPARATKSALVTLAVNAGVKEVA